MNSPVLGYALSITNLSTMDNGIGSTGNVGGERFIGGRSGSSGAATVSGYRCIPTQPRGRRSAPSQVQVHAHGNAHTRTLGCIRTHTDARTRCRDTSFEVEPTRP
ncbi:hypothetical protein WN48_03699 [Eufriesea mexicana]|nr:hypothetical protein WN48_03699 [Eufriesea mexicana]